MPQKAKKEDQKDKKIIFVLAAVIIIILGFYMLKPAITGFVVVTKETTYSDDLFLVINESKEVIWNLRNPGNLQLIKASGAISRNGTAKVYIQKGDEKILIFDSTKQLFDINIEVLPDYKKIFQGDDLLIQIILFNLRGFGSADVNVKYSIKDPNGNIIAMEEEVVSVETQAKFVRKLLIPSDLKSGAYVAFVEVTTPDGLIGTSSDLFEVTVKYEQVYPIQLKYLVFGIAIVLIAALAIFIFNNLKKKKEVIEFKEKIPEEKIQKLEKELAALQSAYKSKFISEASYKKDKERIEKKLKR